MIKLKSLILNEDVSNKTIINVDIQPEYQRIFSFKIYEFTEFINENFHKFSNVIFLYNGRDTVGELSEFQRQQISEGLQRTVKCEYCGKIVVCAVYGRLHGNKCKLRSEELNLNV
jgi:hypothetical protein